MDKRYNLIIHSEPKILFEPKILWRFLLENKFLPDNGFFDLRPIDVYQKYKKYVKHYDLQMVSLTKNLDSFFNLELLRSHQYFCYHIKDIEPNEFRKLIGKYYKDYQKNNKYSTPSGFKNDFTITTIKSKIDIILDDIETSKFQQIYTLENQTNVFIHKTPLINLYTSTLNEIELYEYLNILNELIENFEPENQNESKYPFKKNETKDLFNYLVDNWNYDKDLKYAYIYNYIEQKPYKTDYEKYIRSKYSFTGRFQYENANSTKCYDDLKDLNKSFSKK